MFNVDTADNGPQTGMYAFDGDLIIMAATVAPDLLPCHIESAIRAWCDGNDAVVR